MGVETGIWYLKAAAMRIFLFFGGNRGGTCRKFVIIAQAKLGDMVCTTPVFRAIKGRFRDAEVHVFGRGSNRDILTGNPNVNNYLCREDRDLSGWIAYFRGQKYDFGVSTAPDVYASVLLLAGGVRKVVLPEMTGGRASGDTSLYRMFRILAEKENYRMGAYAPREILGLLRPAGITVAETKKEVYVDPESLASVKLKIPEISAHGGRRRIGMIVGAGNTLKCWPESYQAEFAHAISGIVPCVIFLVGAESETHQSEEIRRLSRTDLVDTVGKLSLRELVALISRMDLVVGVDTGPIYIAEALGIPTIDITGPVDEKEQPPIGERNVVLYGDVPCRPCSRVQNTATECRIGERLCLTRVAPSDVVRSAVALLDA